DELGVQPSLSLKFSGTEEWLAGIARVIERPEAARFGIRNELHVASGRNLVEPGNDCLLVQPSVDLRRHPRPVIGFIVSRYISRNRHAPLFRPRAVEPQAAKWDRRPDDVSVRRDARPRVPERIPR